MDVTGFPDVHEETIKKSEKVVFSSDKENFEIALNSWNLPRRLENIVVSSAVPNLALSTQDLPDEIKDMEVRYDNEGLMHAIDSVNITGFAFYSVLHSLVLPGLFVGGNFILPIQSNEFIPYNLESLGKYDDIDSPKITTVVQMAYNENTAVLGITDNESEESIFESEEHDDVGETVKASRAAKRRKREEKSVRRDNMSPYISTLLGMLEHNTHVLKEDISAYLGLKQKFDKYEEWIHEIISPYIEDINMQYFFVPYRIEQQRLF